jgi:hypothetical protein
VCVCVCVCVCTYVYIIYRDIYAYVQTHTLTNTHTHTPVFCGCAPNTPPLSLPNFFPLYPGAVFGRGEGLLLLGTPSAQAFGNELGGELRPERESEERERERGESEEIFAFSITIPPVNRMILRRIRDARGSILAMARLAS